MRKNNLPIEKVFFCKIKQFFKQIVDFYKTCLLSPERQLDIIKKRKGVGFKVLKRLNDDKYNIFDFLLMYCLICYIALEECITTIITIFIININTHKFVKKMLNEELEVHFEELSEIIYKSEKNKKLATIKIYKFFILDMWIQRLYEEKVWLPYLSKIWIFVETQIMGTFTRF